MINIFARDNVKLFLKGNERGISVRFIDRYERLFITSYFLLTSYPSYFILELISQIYSIFFLVPVHFQKPDNPLIQLSNRIFDSSTNETTFLAIESAKSVLRKSS